MSAEARRRALDALNRARPAIGRLDRSRGTTETIGDLLDVWNAIEASLRALVETPGSAGQALIREASSRGMIGFDQANALAELQAVHDRAATPGFQPTDADLNSARTAYIKLETALLADAQSNAVASPLSPPAQRVDTPPPFTRVDPVGAGLVRVDPPRKPWVRGGIALAVIVGIVALGAVAYVTVAPGKGASATLTAGIRQYELGQREAAAGSFTMAVRENAKNPLPHVYLARMAREAGNMTLANDELQLAIQADPNNGLAQREMGSYLLAANNPELATRFYGRAIEADQNDKVAMGWLGCALLRLNRVPEAQRWLSRAGEGDWTQCTTVKPGG